MALLFLFFNIFQLQIDQVFDLIEIHVFKITILDLINDCSKFILLFPYFFK